MLKSPKSKMIDQAFDLAEKLSKNFPFVRVDLYIIGEKIYFGELTFTPAAGLDSDFKLLNLQTSIDFQLLCFVLFLSILWNLLYYAALSLLYRSTSRLTMKLLFLINQK